MKVTVKGDAHVGDRVLMISAIIGAIIGGAATIVWLAV
jgi:hypothetical protein